MAQLSPMRMKVRDIIAQSKGENIKGQNHYDTKLTGDEMAFINANKNAIANRRPGGFVDRMVGRGMNSPTRIMKGTEPKAVATANKDVVPAFYFGDVSSGGSSDAAASREARQNVIRRQGFSEDSGGGSGGGERGRAGLTPLQKLQRDYDRYKAGEAARKEAAKKEGVTDYMGERRQQLTGEFGDYKTRYKGLEDQWNFEPQRQALGALSGDLKQVGQDYGTATANLLPGVEAIRLGQAGIGTRIGGLAEQALDPTKSATFQQNRGMLAGIAEAQRNAQQRGAQEKLFRGLAGSGTSPEKIALAKAQLAQGYGQQARQDALSTAMGAQQMTGQQLTQGAGLYGQQAGLGIQEANLYGQQAGLAGQKFNTMSGNIGQMAGLQGQTAGLLQQQLAGKAGMISGQTGMTEYQLQDLIAQQTAAEQDNLAQQQMAANAEAARLNASGKGGGGGLISNLFSSIGL